MRWVHAALGAGAVACAVAFGAGPADAATATYRITKTTWTEADERGFGEFVQAIGESGCSTTDKCLKSPANPYRGTDPAGISWYADCADLPYVLRAYYAWKNGLPFSYVTAVSPVGRSRDIRYAASGNRPTARRDFLTGEVAGATLVRSVPGISSAMFRIHPDYDDASLPSDLYSAAINRDSIRPGTVVYDPNGHLAVVYKVEDDGRILMIDAHPDNTISRISYGRKFVRARPSMGAGFKNWRRLTLEGATKAADGSYVGGRIVAASNAEHDDFGTEQFFGTEARGEDYDSWTDSVFVHNEEQVDYYDFVRRRIAKGDLKYEPVTEMRNMMRSLCDDIRYRAEAVDIAIANGIHQRAQPASLPANIYGTDGDWELYSTPSRDARLKTAFKEKRDLVEEYVKLWRMDSPRVTYGGADLVGELLAAYDDEAAKCSVTYTNSAGSPVTLGYEDVRARLFRLSFDPYHCVEHRWGAEGAEAATCTDG